MKGKLLSLAAVAALAIGFASTSAMAGSESTGNGAQSGPHYNLNIIGVTNPKKADMTNSNRHTIFMPLYTPKTKSGGGKDVYSIDGTSIEGQIWLTPGPDFRVCDGNGFDAAYGCPGFNFDAWWNGDFYDDTGTYEGDLGDPVSRKQGATFMLPCNENIVADGADSFVPCDIDAANIMDYTVYVMGGGKLGGGSANMTTCATYDDGSGNSTSGDGDLVCSTGGTINISKITGKNQFTEVTQELGSLLVVLCDGELLTSAEFDACVLGGGTVTTERVALFSGDTEDWFWNYDNNGLRLAKLRFYENE